MTCKKIKEFVVYQATNTINGKQYIGASSFGIDSRKKEHIWDALRGKSRCKLFHRAIRKYGEENFEWKILAKVSSFEELMIQEIELIAELKPKYNMTSGGQGIKGLPRTQQWRERTSKALKGRKLSKQRIEALRKMDKSFQYKSVVCLDDGLFFDSIKKAAAHYGINSKRIGEVLHGRQLRCGDKCFVYADKEMSFEQCKEKLCELETRIRFVKERLASGSLRNKPVLCTTDGKIHRGGAAAARFYDVSQMTISNICNIGGQTKIGLSFRFT